MDKNQDPGYGINIRKKFVVYGITQMQNNNVQLTWESRRKNLYGKTRSAFSFTHCYSLESIIIKKKNLLQKYNAELTPNPRVKKIYCFYVNKPQKETVAGSHNRSKNNKCINVTKYIV
jgi:hypothetical protein